MNHRSIILKKISAVFLLVIMQVTSLPVTVLAQEISPMLEQSQEKEELVGGIELDPSQIILDQATASGEVEVNLEENGQASAHLKSPTIIRKLVKSDYKVDEIVPVVISNGNESAADAVIIDGRGDRVETRIQQMVQNGSRILRILPPASFRPGKYTLIISDDSGQKMEQDFTWGVLAINANKSMYTPHEKAHLAMAVLDDLGMMVCNASVTLQVTTPQTQEITLSTENGKIQVNPECLIKDYVEKPDYEAEYQLDGVGNYDLVLSATTENGIYTIEDRIEVRESVPFVVERKTATRIYPVAEYPVEITVTANEDFSGEITEVVPQSFLVTQGSFDDKRVVSQERLKKETVLGASTKLSMPFDGSFAKTNTFGDRDIDPLLLEKYVKYGVVGHDGVDFALPIGTPVISVDNGEVVLAEIDGDYGTTLVIQHRWGKSYYGHLSSMKVKVGQRIKRGDEIALSGNTGLSTGPHLHFGIKPEENDFSNGYFGKVDPAPFLGIVESQSVLGAQTSLDESQQLLVWKMNMKKGETKTLSYKYDAPDISPQFYTLGPLHFMAKSPLTGKDLGGSIFEEARQWQIAVDPTEDKYASSHITGAFLNPNNAVGSTTGTWAGETNVNTNYTSRWAMDNPTGAITGTQTVAVLARKGSNSGTPTIALNLYENGTLVQSIVGATNVTSTTGQTISGTFNGSVISNPNNVEIEVVQVSAGGSPSARNSAQIDYIRWTVNLLSTITTVGTSGTQTSNIQLGSSNQYIGGAFTMSTNTGTASITSITLSEQGTINASSHLSNIDIYYETAGTCTYNGTETLFGTDTTVTTEQAVVTGSISVGTSQVCLYVVADVSGSATAGQTIEFQITNPSTQVTASTGTVSPSTAVAIAGTTTITAPSSFTQNNYRWYNNAASSSTPDGGPTKIDDAGDPGIMSGHGRQVLRTSTGTLYAMIGERGVCEVWKSTDGTSWAQQDSIDSPTNCNVVSAAIDSNDAIHMVYINISTLRVRYVAYDTATDSFALNEEIMTNGQTTLLQTDIVLDSNNKPHVLAVRGGTFDTLTYANKVSGAWSTVDIAGAASTTHARNPSITISEDDIPEVAYIDHTNADVVAAVGNANNTTSFTSHVIDIQAQTTAGVAGASIGVDSSGNTWVAYVDDGATDIIMLQSHPDASAWSSGWSATWDSALEVGYEPSLAIDGTDIYVFYENDLDDVVYDMYDGASWSGEVTLQTGTFQDVKARWAFSNDNDSTGVGSSLNTYYFDGSDVAAIDSNNAWTNETNADDGSTTTFATATTANYGESANNLKIEGTNAPASGGTIVGVRARVHNGLVWGSYVTVNAPTGGWSWSAVQGLETAVFGDNVNFVTSGAMIYENGDYQGTILAMPQVGLNLISPDVSRVEILVQTSSDQNELDYLYSDGTDIYWASVGLSLSVNLGSARANENTAASSVSTASPIRLRSGITLGGSDLAAGAVQFKLQYGTSTSGPWTDVGTGDWAFEDNANISDGVELSSTVLTGTDVAQTYEEDNPTVANISAMTVGQDGEWDFSLDPTNAIADTTYYFRLVKSDGTALGTYTRYPTLTMASTGGGGIAFVKQTTGKSTVATTSETFSVTSTAGNTLILMTTIAAGSTVRLTGVTDSAGNTWVVPAAGQSQNPPSNYVSGSNTYFAMAYVVNASAITSITITTSASDDFGFNLVEFSGIVTASPVDQSASAGNIAATSQTTPSITTTNATDLIIGGLTAPSTTRTLNTSGYTALTDWDTSSATIGKGSGAYRIVSAIGTYSITWDLGASQAVGTGIMAFKGTGGGGAETPTLSQLMRHGSWFNSSGARQPFTF